MGKNLFFLLLLMKYYFPGQYYCCRWWRKVWSDMLTYFNISHEMVQSVVSAAILWVQSLLRINILISSCQLIVDSDDVPHASLQLETTGGQNLLTQAILAQQLLMCLLLPHTHTWTKYWKCQSYLFVNSFPKNISWQSSSLCCYIVTLIPWFS